MLFSSRWDEIDCLVRNDEGLSIEEFLWKLLHKRMRLLEIIKAGQKKDCQGSYHAGRTEIELTSQRDYNLKLVIQGSHMVSGTRCPAWSNKLQKWSESRAAAPKGRCREGHG